MKARFRLALFALAFGTAIAACSANTVDLDAVDKLASTASAAAPAMDAVASGYLASCLRYHALQAETRIGSRSLTDPPVDVASTPAPQPSDASKVLSLVPIPANGDPDCVQVSASTQRWLLENKVVIGFIGALGNIAKVNTAPSPAPFATAAAELKKLGVLHNDASATAAGNFAAALATAFLRRRQERDIIAFVHDAQDAGWPTFIASLTAVDGYYEDDLALEEPMLNSRETQIASDLWFVYMDARKQGKLPVDPAYDSYLKTLSLTPEDMQVLPAVAGSGATLTPAVRAARYRADHLRAELLDLRYAWSTQSQVIHQAVTAAESYRATIVSLDKAEGKIITATSGLPALAADLKPMIEDFQSSVSALLSSTTPAATANSTKPASK